MDGIEILNDGDMVRGVFFLLFLKSSSGFLSTRSSVFTLFQKDWEKFIYLVCSYS